MKIDSAVMKPVDWNKCGLRMKDVYARTERDINEFLKTRKGLTYLRMKYPNLSIPEAIQEYKADAYTALNI